MNRNEAVSYLHKFIKKANPEQLRSLVCATFSPFCSNDCPLRNGLSCNCKEIIEEEKHDEENS